jgi:hypothetical protein
MLLTLFFFIKVLIHGCQSFNTKMLQNIRSIYNTVQQWFTLNKIEDTCSPALSQLFGHMDIYIYPQSVPEGG